MNAEEWINLWLNNVTNSHLQDGGRLREGQQAFNLLYEHNPILADEIRGTRFDPFHDDGKLTRFFEYVRNRWDETYRVVFLDGEESGDELPIIDFNPAKPKGGSLQWQCTTARTPRHLGATVRVLYNNRWYSGLMACDDPAHRDDVLSQVLALVKSGRRQGTAEPAGGWNA